MTGLRKYAVRSSVVLVAGFCLAGSALADGMERGRKGHYERPYSWSGFYVLVDTWVAGGLMWIGSTIKQRPLSQSA